MSALKIVKVSLIGSLALGGLVACGDDNKAATLPTRSAAPSPSTTADLEASAEAFVVEWSRAYDEAQHGGEIVPLESDFYAPECAPCQRALSILKEDRQKGRHVEGYEGVVLEVHATLTPSGALVAFKGYRKAGRIVRDSDGSTVEPLSETKPVRTTLTLWRKADSWRIGDITRHGAES